MLNSIIIDNEGTTGPVPLSFTPSKLPHFITEHLPQEFQSHGVSAALQNSPVVIGVPQLLERFAVFVAALVETEEVAFLALDLDTEKDTEGRDGHTVVHGAVSSARDCANARADLVSVPAVDTNTHELDFVLNIGSRGENVSTSWTNSGVFVLEVSPTEPGRADLFLNLRADYGPSIAASHLLQLAAFYLASHTPHAVPSAPATASSIKFPRQQAVKQDENTVPTEKLLHGAFESHVSTIPQSMALDYLSSTSDPSPNQELSYAELDALATDMAKEIRLLVRCLEWKPVVGQQRIVPFLLPSGPQLSIGILGALKAGHAFAPLQLDAPADRLRDMLDDMSSPVVLGMGPNPWAGLESEDQSDLGSIVWVDVTDLKAWRAQYVEQLQNIDDGSSAWLVPSEGDLAYLIYTSGSTGKPKGVLVPHRAAVGCIESFATGHPHLPTGSDLRWFVMCSPSFDIFIMEMFLALFLGGTLCVAERQRMLTDTEAAINDLRANATFSVASLAMVFRPERMPTLKTLVCGGEMMTQRVVDNFAPAMGAVGDKELINLWGPAETAMANTTVRCSTSTRFANIGEPFPTSKLFIIDPDSAEPKELPLGMTGELALGGPQVGLGYLNRPEETAKSFIDSPDLGRIYRTGDKGRIVWSQDGTPSIEIMGRIAMGQVKLNGRRVELGEIEAVISKADALAEVAVVVSGVRLVACVVPVSKDPSAYDGFETQCRSKAEQYLPAWMRPTEYLVLPHLSRSAAGRKLDRKSLAAMLAAMDVNEEADDNTDSGYSDGEIDPSDIPAIIYNGLVASIGRHVLQADRSTLLFSLGFHSLRAMVFLQSVREYDVHELKIQDLLSGVTIDEVIQLVEERRKTPGKDVGNEVSDMQVSMDLPEEIDSEELLEYPVQTRLRHFDSHCRAHCLQALGFLCADEIEEVLPTVSLQNHFLVGYQQSCRDSRQGLAKPFTEHFVYQLPPSWELTRLQRAVERVIRRHDMFRTVFVEVDHPLSPFAQCILSPSSPRAAIPRVELVVNEYSKDPDSLWQQTVENAQRSAETALRMDRPGYVLSYVRTEDRSHAVFILSIFHPIFDGVSLALVRSEIADEYLRDNTEEATGPVQRSMRRLVEKNLETDWFESRFYWMKRFAGKPKFQIGPQCPAPASLSLNKSSCTSKIAQNMEGQDLLLDITMDDLVAAAASKLSTTPMAVFQAAWTLVLARTWVAKTPSALQEGVKLDVQFGSVLHGRHDTEALRCVAPMLTTVPMSIGFDDIYSTQNLPSNRDMCQQIARQHAETIPYQQIPCPTLDMVETQLRFDSLLNVQTYSASDHEDLPGFNWQENRLQSYQESDNGFPILMEVWPGWGSTKKPIYLKCSYNTAWPGYEFLTAEWVQGLLVAFKEAISNVVEAPDAAFSVVAM